MDIISLIASAIKSKRKEVVNFIISHGGSINLNDSDVRIGDELSKVLSSSQKNREDFATILSGKNISNNDGSDWGSWFKGITGASDTTTTTTTSDSTSDSTSGESKFANIFSAVTGGLTGIFGTVGDIAAGGSGPTGADMLRMQLINQNIERDKKASATITVAIIALVVVMIAVGFLIYKKYQ